jgi:hypothetical protein
VSDNWLSDIIGDPANAKTVELAGHALQRVMRRAEYSSQREGKPGPTVRAGMTLSDAALAIALCLRRGDQPAARDLIDAAGQLFDHSQLVAQIGQAAQDFEASARQEARAMREVHAQQTRSATPEVQVDRHPRAQRLDAARQIGAEQGWAQPSPGYVDSTPADATDEWPDTDPYYEDEYQDLPDDEALRRFQTRG